MDGGAGSGLAVRYVLWRARNVRILERAFRLAVAMSNVLVLITVNGEEFEVTETDVRGDPEQGIFICGFAPTNRRIEIWLHPDIMADIARPPWPWE